MCANALAVHQASVGIQPIKLVPGGDEPALLSRRARLLLRVGARRMDELMALAGLDLSVDGHRLRLGAPHKRELQPHATLYAYKVAADSADEVAFMATVTRELDTLAIGGERVCGKRRRMVISGRVLDTFSLMLHALPEDNYCVCSGVAGATPAVGLRHICAAQVGGCRGLIEVLTIEKERRR